MENKQLSREEMKKVSGGAWRVENNQCPFCGADWTPYISAFYSGGSNVIHCPGPGCYMHFFLFTRSDGVLLCDDWAGGCGD